MDCQTCRRELVDWVSDNLSVARREEIQRHLDGCIACAQERHNLYSLVRLLESFPEADSRMAERKRIRPWIGFAAGFAASAALVWVVLAIRSVPTLIVTGTQAVALRVGQSAKIEDKAGMELGGHQVTAFPGTRLEWRGGSTLRIEEGALHVVGNGKDLAIETEAGRVGALGTEFWVCVIRREKEMNRLKQGMAGVILGVTVTSGAVAISNSRGTARIDKGSAGVA